MKRLFLYLLFYILIYLTFTPTQTRSTIIRQEGDVVFQRVPQRVSAGDQHLFIIAIDRYQQWPDLPGPVFEAGEFKKQLLSNYHIDRVVELYNEKACKENIRNCLVNYQADQPGALGERDSLIIYFSGHGQAFPEEIGNGYWIPYDGGQDINARSYWLGNAELVGLVKKIPAGQVLIISDSCFAATLIDTHRGVPASMNAPPYPHRYAQGKARKVLTAGGLERVPGHSEFARLLIGALAANKRAYIDMASLYMDIREEVFQKTGNQPGYGNLKHAGFDPGASFVLFTHQGWQEWVKAQEDNRVLGLNFDLTWGERKILSIKFGL